jgi:hypothetical protein
VGVRATVRFEIDEAGIADLKNDPELIEYAHKAGEDFGEHLRSVTPRASGAGAASISAHDSRAKGATDVGWDAAHYYLIFPEYGTKYQTAQRFTRALLDDYTY